MIKLLCKDYIILNYNDQGIMPGKIQPVLMTGCIKDVRFKPPILYILSIFAFFCSFGKIYYKGAYYHKEYNSSDISQGSTQVYDISQ